MAVKAERHSHCIETFAKITASISHEIKNVLAIINENSGLLDDLAVMSDPERGIDPERTQKIAATIARQVQRANVIMKDLNRFAHSSDSVYGQESLPDLLRLMLTLSGRQAAMKNITTSLACPEKLIVTTNILALEALVYLLLRRLIDSSRDQDPISLSVTKDDAEIAIVFGAPCLIDESTAKNLTANDFAELCTAINGKLGLVEGHLQLNISNAAHNP
jgi:signal transduction histidine kinase